jgi:hypothetical protein
VRYLDIRKDDQLDEERLCQRLHPALGLADRGQPSMDQHQRFGLAVDLVIEVDAIHMRVAAADWFHFLSS